ncbi:hypothetical protein C0J52_09162 [Blattella germanica]|nr:hypothetical protein C0J52_09162 [Blattella germanica]
MADQYSSSVEDEVGDAMREWSVDRRTSQVKQESSLDEGKGAICKRNPAQKPMTSERKFATLR